jgi:hypothetical protein
VSVTIRRNLTLIEVSNEYGGSPWTWRKRAREGVVSSIKPAGEKSRIMIPREEVERFLAEGFRPRIARTAEGR